MSPAVIAIGIVILALAFGFALHAIRSGISAGDRDPDAPPRGPWWGRPEGWVAISVISLIVGLFLAPRFFGSVVVFLPFLLMGRMRRSHRPPDQEHTDR